MERLSKDNLPDVVKLYAGIHTKPHPLSYFQKKYGTAYTGAQYVGYIAYNKRHLPIAFYGLVPCFIKHEERMVLAAQSADTMTHPKYRYKGLFVHLASITIELGRQSGIKLIFGLPSQVALHGFLIKLQWQLTETMSHFNIPVRFIPFERMLTSTPLTRGLYHIYQHRLLKRYLLPQQGIYNSILHEGSAGVYRDEEYWEHKTCNKTHVIKIGRALVWIKISGKLIIGDMNVSEDDFEEVMAKLKKIARKLGLAKIEFHTSHATKLCSLFAERYSGKLSLHVLFKDLGSGLPLDEIKFTYADAEIF